MLLMSINKTASVLLVVQLDPSKLTRERSTGSRSEGCQGVIDG